MKKYGFLETSINDLGILARAARFHARMRMDSGCGLHGVLWRATPPGILWTRSGLGGIHGIGKKNRNRLTTNPLKASERLRSPSAPQLATVTAAARNPRGGSPPTRYRGKRQKAQKYPLIHGHIFWLKCDKLRRN